MFRFSLLTLLGAVLVVSIGCAALASASDAWAKVIVTATVLAMLTATVGACYLPGRAKAFAGGFAIFGWGYLLVAQGPWFESVNPQLVTTVALNKLRGLMHEDVDAQVSVNSGLQYLALNAQSKAANSARWVTLASAGSTIYFDGFHQIGQSLWAILLACVGGVLARGFAGSKVKVEAA